jgi:ankyrin repeat protein
MQSQSQLGLEKNAHLQLSRELFLHCYRDEFDSLVNRIKKQLRENEGNAAAENLKKDVNTRSCPEDAWLPSPKFDILVQNAKSTWANLVDIHGRTLLHYCCGSKQELAPLAARYLLDSKASLLICDADGKFPVHYLARQGNVLMFERCPEFLRVVNQKSENASAETPYDVAKSKKQTSFINFLIAKCPRIMEDVHKIEATRKLNSHRHSPSLDSPIISRRPSSAKSSDYNALSPTSTKRDSLKSNKSDDNEGIGPLYEFDEDDEFNDSAERLATVPSFHDLLGEAQKEQSDVDELYRIACEFTKWEPPMSKALVLRWFNMYVYNRGSCLDVILRPHCGNAAIHLAVIHGCTDAVIILLKLGASTDVQNDDGHTPLHLACMLGFAAIVHELLKVGADVHRQDKDGCIPVELITNTSEGVQIVMLMFRFASTLSIDDNERDQSLLETMIEKQHFEIVNLLLLMRPWSAFHVNLKGETLLHCAAKAPYDSTAILTGKVLVSLGVDASTKNSQELTALEVCSELYSPLSSFLSDPLAVHIQRMQSIWHLVQLTELGYWNDQKLFEESSKKFSIADSNSGKAMTLRGSNQSIKHLHKTDSDCNNLLHRACSIGAVALAQKLLNGGMAGLPQNLNGDTPLHVAAFNGQNDIILCLFAVSFTKSLMHSTNKHGFSAFDLAAFQGHVSVLATFLSWGYTEKCDKISPKSLFAAFSGKRWNVVVFLLENLPHESKICLDKDDNNFLHYLAALDSQHVTAFFQQLPSSKIHFLFEKRCIKKKNIMNMDPFEMAGKKHNVAFLGVFRRYCASCIVCCARQFVARRRLHQRKCAATSQATALWKVKGYPYAMTKGFVLWTGIHKLFFVM